MLARCRDALRKTPAILADFGRSRRQSLRRDVASASAGDSPPPPPPPTLYEQFVGLHGMIKRLSHVARTLRSAAAVLYLLPA